ncbi:MAG: ABC transporter permease [Bacteroidetes bacterium]|jgi:lipoprotein-releasing system permease protein|nr:ABC transporter permease [Bacteroidota bacterium]
MSVSSFIASKTFGRKNRSFSGFIIRLTTAAVALSISVMIIAVCIIKGFRSEISEKIFGFWGHIHITHINSHEFQEVPLVDTMPWLEDLRNLQNTSVENHELGDFIQPIAYYHRTAHLSAILQTENQIEGLIMKGVDTLYNWPAFQPYIDTEDLELESYQLSGRNTIISRTTARRLSLEEGDQAVLYFIKDGQEIPRRFKVEGIYHTGIQEFDEKLAFVPLQELRSILGWSDRQIGGVDVFVKDIGELDALAKYIYFDIVPMDIVARSITQRLQPIFQWLELQKVNEQIILLLMIAICILNMSTGVFILIFERMRMLGLLTTLGYPHRVLQRIFLHYAGYILVRGLIWGNLIGIGLCAIQFFFQPITLDEESYYLAYAPIHFDWMKILWINLFSSLLILVFMVLPTLFLRKVDPIKALGFRS